MKSNKALTFIFITLLIDCTGIGIIIPVIPGIIQEITHCTINEASTYGGFLLLAYACMQFLFSPVLGGISDRYGRRPVLLISLLGLGLDYIILALANSLWMLYAGRIFAGICGASFTTASAYIADVSNEENRSKNFGLLGAAFGLGFILGPVLGSALSSLGLRAPFYGAAILSLINFFFGLFILPESLSKENRRKFDIKRANPFGAFVHLKKYKSMYGLLAAMFLVYIAGNAVQSTWNYYTMYKFKWDEQLVGYSLAFIGVAVALVQGGLIRIIIPKIGQKKAVLYGMLLYALGLVLFSIAWEGWMMFVFLIPYAIAGIAGPAIQSLLSSKIPSNEQGELQGTITSLISITMIIGPALMTNLFYFFSSPDAEIYFPGAPYLAGAIFTLIGFFIATRALKKFD